MATKDSRTASSGLRRKHDQLGRGPRRGLPRCPPMDLGQEVRERQAAAQRAEEVRKSATEQLMHACGPVPKKARTRLAVMMCLRCHRSARRRTGGEKVAGCLTQPRSSWVHRRLSAKDSMWKPQAKPFGMAFQFRREVFKGVEKERTRSLSTLRHPGSPSYRYLLTALWTLSEKFMASSFPALSGASSHIPSGPKKG